jgi:uncharacterized protein (TIGR02145 family)
LCPNGWHVPSDQEWTSLTNYISGGTSQGGNQLKSCRQVNSPISDECSTDFHPRWVSDNQNFGFDTYGFTAHSGGYRFNAGNYYAPSVGIFAAYTSTMVPGMSSVYCRYIYHDSQNISKAYRQRKGGLSVRCVKN